MEGPCPIPPSWRSRGRARKSPRAILEQIKGILGSAHGPIDPDSLSSALAGTIGGVTDELRGGIAAETRQGKFDLLRRHLPERPDESGFDPSRLGLASGTKDDYLAALEASFLANKKLDLLLPAYVFSRSLPEDATLKEYLFGMGEGDLDMIKDAHSKKKSAQEIAAAMPDKGAKNLRKFLERRLGRIGRDVSKHTKSVVETARAVDATLTLTEVHPNLGIFRGNLGGDCATSHSFGFANAPTERVFFITNARGEAVGYANGANVVLPDGKRGFFINTVAGARISGLMTRSIFSGFEKAKEALGADAVLVLGRNMTTGNINHPAIRTIYGEVQGRAVQIGFPDSHFRETIGRAVESAVHDGAEALTNAHYLNDPGSAVAVTVEARPFELDGYAPGSAFDDDAKALLYAHSPRTAERLGLEDAGEIRVSRRVQSQIEAAMSDRRADLQDRFRLAENYNAFAPAEDAAAVMGKLREAMEEAMADREIGIRARLNAAVKYGEFAPAGDAAAVMGKLREPMEAAMADRGIGIWGRLDAAAKYAKFAPEGDAAAVMDKLREIMEETVADGGIGIRDRLSAVVRYGEFAPAGDAAVFMGKLREPMEETMADTGIGIRDRLDTAAIYNAAARYAEFAPDGDAAAVMGKLREVMEETVADGGIGIRDRLDAVVKYGEFAPRRGRRRRYGQTTGGYGKDGGEPEDGDTGSFECRHQIRGICPRRGPPPPLWANYGRLWKRRWRTGGWGYGIV